MKTSAKILVMLALCIAAGCQGPVASDGKKDLMTVDFQKGQALRYRFNSGRDIEIDWGPSKGKGSSHKVNEFSETSSVVISYNPVDVNPYGLTTIKATCESVSISRSSATHRRVKNKDVVEQLKGKSFTIKIGPTGKIEDYSGLEKLLKELGRKAFRPNSKQGRIKEPDMICDIFATQWFLWDAVSSMNQNTEGITAGQTWKSQLSVPTPMVMKKARDVTYKLSEISDTNEGRVAVIDSSYSLAERTPKDWPMPYSGSFQMSGTFGFLRKYKVETLKGTGREFFNIDAGRINSYSQEYKTKISAVLPIPVDVNPVIRIRQKLEMKLLEK